MVRDLRANIAAEAGARQTYEALIKACDDDGTKKTLHASADARNHARQHVHEGAGSMGKLDDPMFGNVPPDETVKLVFNLSQGEDVRGPWNEAPDFDYVADPEPAGRHARPRRSIPTTKTRRRRREKPRRGRVRTKARGRCPLAPGRRAAAAGAFRTIYRND